MATDNIPAPDGNSKGFARRWISYDKFSVFTTFLGFVADIISISTILFAVRVDTPSGFTPYHALLVWFVLVFGYICLLQAYWRHKRNELDNITFSAFLFAYIPGNSLYLYLPLFVALLILVWILAAIWMSLSDEDQFGLTGLVCLPMFFIVFICVAAFSGWLEEHKTREFNKALDNDWAKWDRLVAARLKGYQWISPSSFQDVQREYNIKSSDIERLLAKYAMRHPQTVYYGIVANKSTGQNVHDEAVLISIKGLDRSEYTF